MEDKDKNLLPIPTLTDTLVQRKSNIWHKNTDTYFVQTFGKNIWCKNTDTNIGHNNLLPIPTLTDTLVQRKSNIWHKKTDTTFGHKILAIF